MDSAMLQPREALGLYDPAQERDACGVGLIAQLHGNPDRSIVIDALSMLSRMFHRGATGVDEASGDGAGMLARLPRRFLTKVALELNIELPELYGVGMLFLAQSQDTQAELQSIVEATLIANGMTLLGWRRVPTNGDILGKASKADEPAIFQLFLAPTDASIDPVHLERQLYIVRQQSWNAAQAVLYRDGRAGRPSEFHFASLSCKTIVYKGQLTARQVLPYFTDLNDDDFETDLALVHSRFSTNTFPSWDRAQPNRCMSHNGEINTVRGNINSMGARQGLMKAKTLGLTPEQLKSIMPIIPPGLSDSGDFNAVLEFLMASGRSAPECMMMMIPEAWQNAPNMDPERRAFYEYMSCLMEPWDGPALVAFTDGRYVGATLDRNGLRPGRYYEMTDGRVIMASEFGVVTVNDADVKHKGRLSPGRMLMIDFDEHRIVLDEELKARFTSRFPFAEWLREHKRTLQHFVSPEEVAAAETAVGAGPVADIVKEMAAFGWTRESMNLILQPMLKDGMEALGSMGNDAPLACLSQRSRLLFDFFKQLFAQVSNPPLDSTREYIVMSLVCMVGPEGDLADTTPEQAGRLSLEHPFLLDHELQGLQRGIAGWPTITLDFTFPVEEGPKGLQAAIARLQEAAVSAVRDKGSTLIILSDRTADATRVAMPSLMAVGCVHHILVAQELRMRTALVVDTAEAREVHHMCALVGYGVDAICPRLALDVISRWQFDQAAMARDTVRMEAPASVAELYRRYFYALGKGMLKVMAKMGISTLQSYKGAQIFEAVGLSSDIIDVCFCGTASRIGGLTFNDVADNILAQHAVSYPTAHAPELGRLLPEAGEYHYRSLQNAERHLNDPIAMSKMQHAVRTNNKEVYSEYTRIINEINRHTTIRGLLKFDTSKSQPIPLDQVESAADIVKRFATGAMSYGSISLEAHSTLAVAMNRIGAKSNTGEGGEAPARLRPGADGKDHPARSAIKQIASGRFGVTSEYLTHADELQIKMAQGAKPGEGGELPGRKVNAKIAAVRHSTPGVGLISPPPHHDIYSIEDLKQLIFDLKNANPRARISVKLVAEVGVGVVASGVCKAGADHVLVSGHDGGTGASRWTGIKHAGLPWELGLAETHQTLVLNDLRRRIVIQTDGQLKTGRDVVIAALLGAEEFCFATAPLIALGCIMMRKCHLNTCPVGIATQDPVLRKKFQGQPEHVINFFFMLAEEVRALMAQLGVASFKDLVGRSEYLAVDDELLSSTRHYGNFRLEETLLRPAHEMRPNVATCCIEAQPDTLANQLDHSIIAAVQETLDNVSEPVRCEVEFPIANTNRAVGTMLSHEVTRRCTGNPLPDDTLHLKFKGSAGQSFGAWVCQGITLELEGDANDYVGKGLCGGRIIVYPPRTSRFAAEENILAGNVVAYGATSGEIFLNGRAAERFCVRNSGITAVVEGVGDHGCEYMTGGTVVVLGATGRNFAAGMSGGTAYVLDPARQFAPRCNTELVDLEAPSEADGIALRTLVRQHHEYTNSALAARLLADWDNTLSHFIKVMPREYREALKKAEDRREQSKARKARHAAQVAARAAVAAGSGAPADLEEASAGVNSLEKWAAQMKAQQEQGQEELSDGGSTDSEDSGIDTHRPHAVAEADKRRGFIAYDRAVAGYRDVKERTGDWQELAKPLAPDAAEQLLHTQTARCMDCGVPFCNQKTTGCPLGNLIPDFNDLVHRGEWHEAYLKLSETNNFPEFTGRVCPAPCEGSCVLGIIDSPVAIKSVECSIIDRAFAEGWVKPQPPAQRTGRSVAIVGSGPSGLAAADQLNKAGHQVVVYERADRIGGLMMYGVPNMKADKLNVVQRRVDLMAQEGVDFRTNVNVGADVTVASLREAHDALVFAVGSTVPRDLPIPGRELTGVHFAMDFLTENTKHVLASEGSTVEPRRIDVRGKRVVVIGGGDTGNDCIGTAVRLGAASVVNFELLPQPAEKRGADNPWPEWPRIFRVDYGHQEAALATGSDIREYCVLSTRFLGTDAGALRGIETVRVAWNRDDSGRWNMEKQPDTTHIFEADVVLLAMGFLHPEPGPAEAANVARDTRGNYQADFGSFATSEKGVFAAGDCRRGQSLVVWAISEGRGVAAAVDAYLANCERTAAS